MKVGRYTTETTPYGWIRIHWRENEEECFLFVTPEKWRAAQMQLRRSVVEMLDGFVLNGWLDTIRIEDPAVSLARRAHDFAVECYRGGKVSSAMAADIEALYIQHDGPPQAPVALEAPA